MAARPRVLLASVFAPFGVDDEFGRKENVLELYHNQVTRAQGLFSYRFHHHSFGLHLIAANIDAAVTILDFPTLAQFVRELRHAYDYVGISFIVPNFAKAQAMAAAVRRHAPRSVIILGGHGTSIPDLAARIEHDHICRGEGIGFMRRLLGENPDRPFRHPLLPNYFNGRVMGIPVAQNCGTLVTGVGCANMCHFCATAHYFRGYYPLVPTGRDLFAICRAYEERMGYTDFFVHDENFLKQRGRADELLQLMEEAGATYRFRIFSSAETLLALPDLDYLCRLGVTFLWLGVESQYGDFAKNRDVDFPHLIGELRRRGISVLTSAIMFTDDHDRTTLRRDLDRTIALGADFVQFMELCPFPGTQLYEDYARTGRLLADIPWEEQHGQDKIWFRHPVFSREETATLLTAAFREEYKRNGASLLRATLTMLTGYAYLREHADPRLRARAAVLRRQLERMRPLVPVAGWFAATDADRRLLAEIRARYRRDIGPLPMTDVVLAGAAGVLAAYERLRLALGLSVRQPGVTRTTTATAYPVAVAEAGAAGS
ncbi:MAG TPA: cobalamin-dependent protein [bacterium]|nr:cobalamin-dependent protein [bacterium]